MISDHTLASVAAINDAGLSDAAFIALAAIGSAGPQASTYAGKAMNAEQGSREEAIHALRLTIGQLRVLNRSYVTLEAEMSRLLSEQPLEWALQASLEQIG